MTKTKQLQRILEKNPGVQSILEQANNLGMPNWYLGAGGIAQTAWNVLHEFDPQYGIKDYDLVYYDASDTSYEGEDVFIREGKKLFRDIPVLVEIRNQARVHIWYEKRFGHTIEPYQSVEDSIKKWPTTATCIGVRYVDGKFQVYAPYGLDDLLGMVVRANKIQITKEIYRRKVDRWTKIWPKLKVIPWEEE